MAKKKLLRNNQKINYPARRGAGHLLRGKFISAASAAKIIEKPMLKTETVKALEASAAVKKTKIRVIGIGGGAGNIVSEIASRLQTGEQPVKATFVVANTDLQALKSASRDIIRFQFGESFTHGLGAGMNPELASAAAENEKEKIKKMFQGQDLCIIIASLGGGTGSGAAPVFARIAKNAGAMTFGVFTLPFKFEGERKLEIAKDALQRLKLNLNAISILPNERIFQIIDKDTPLKEAFSCINKSLTESLHGLIETIYLPGLINIDFADLRAILQGKGKLAFLNSVEVEGEGRVSDAIKNVINCPLYSYTIRGAKGVMFNIAGEKGLSLSEVSQISKNISELVNQEARIIFGIAENKRYEDKIKVTLLATGCTAKIFSEEAKETKTKIKRLKHHKKNVAKPLARKKVKNKKTKKAKPKKSRKTKNSARNKPIRRIKIKVFSRPSEKEVTPNETGAASFSNTVFPADEPKIQETRVLRKNALQVKKEAEEMEKEFIAKEQAWEAPAFLRLKTFRNPFNRHSQPNEENK
jgi:cell division protein FtsZ